MNAKRGSVLMIFLVAALVISAVIVVFLCGRYLGSNATPAFTHRGPTVKQLERMGHLTVLKLSIGAVLEGDGHGYRGAWLVRGDAIYMIDMRDATLIFKDDSLRQATIELAMPVVQQPRVDHNKTKTYSVEKKSWVPFRGDQAKLRDESMKEAQALVERAAFQPEYVRIAQDNGELVLKNMYSLVGWEITVQWRAPSEDSDQ